MTATTRIKVDTSRMKAYWQEIISDMLGEIERREHSFPVIDEHGRINMPVQSPSGIVRSSNVVPDLKGYRGLALQINDHGNVTLWDCFVNGRKREIASRV